MLYAYLHHHSLVSLGRTAARVASAVISHHGAVLTPEAALASLLAPQQQQQAGQRSWAVAASS